MDLQRDIAVDKILIEGVKEFPRPLRLDLINTALEKA